MKRQFTFLGQPGVFVHRRTDHGSEHSESVSGSKNIIRRLRNFALLLRLFEEMTVGFERKRYTADDSNILTLTRGSLSRRELVNNAGQLGPVRGIVGVDASNSAGVQFSRCRVFIFQHGSQIVKQQLRIAINRMA